MKLIIIVGVLLVSVACGGDDPVAPTPPSPAAVNGGWSGTFESNYSPEAVFMDLTQAGSAVTGTWAQSSGLRANGTISGTVTPSTFTGLVTYSYSNGPVCQGSFSGAASGSTLNWSSPGFTGTCGLSAPGNPVNVRFVMQRR